MMFDIEKKIIFAATWNFVWRHAVGRLHSRNGEKIVNQYWWTQFKGFFWVADLESDA